MKPKETPFLIHTLIGRECIGEQRLSPSYLLPWINKKGSGFFEISYTRDFNNSSRTSTTKIHQISYIINDGTCIKDLIKYNFLHRKRGRRVKYTLHGFYLKRMYRSFCVINGSEDRYLSEFFIEFPKNLLSRELIEEDYRLCCEVFKESSSNNLKDWDL